MKNTIILQMIKYCIWSKINHDKYNSWFFLCRQKTFLISITLIASSFMCRFILPWIPFDFQARFIKFPQYFPINGFHSGFSGFYHFVKKLDLTHMSLNCKLQDAYLQLLRQSLLTGAASMDILLDIFVTLFSIKLNIKLCFLNL